MQNTFIRKAGAHYAMHTTIYTISGQIGQDTWVSSGKSNIMCHTHHKDNPENTQASDHVYPRSYELRYVLHLIVPTFLMKHTLNSTFFHPIFPFSYIYRCLSRVIVIYQKVIFFLKTQLKIYFFQEKEYILWHQNGDRRGCS